MPIATCLFPREVVIVDGLYLVIQHTDLHFSLLLFIVLHDVDHFLRRVEGMLHEAKLFAIVIFD